MEASSPLMCQNQDQGFVVPCELCCVAQKLGLEIPRELVNSQVATKLGRLFLPSAFSPILFLCCNSLEQGISVTM